MRSTCRTAPRSVGPTVVLALLLVLALLRYPSGLYAQSGVDLSAPLAMTTGVGWAASIPDAMLGGGVFHMFGERRWGLYLEAKIPHESMRRDPDFRGDLTIARVEAEFESGARILLRDHDEWRLVNAGLVRALSPQSALLLGIGAARKSVLREYGDTTDPPFTRTGFYFVENEELSGWHLNWNAGVLLRGGQQIAFSTGFEWVTRALTLGVLIVVR